MTNGGIPMIAIRYLKSALVGASILAVTSYSGKGSAQTGGTSSAGVVDDEAGIRSTLASYSDALNGGKTAAVLPLYTDDGVFMPPYSPSSIGKEAVRKAYDAVFDEL